jgi:hypothetical protein
LVLVAHPYLVPTVATQVLILFSARSQATVVVVVVLVVMQAEQVLMVVRVVVVHQQAVQLVAAVQVTHQAHHHHKATTAVQEHCLAQPWVLAVVVVLAQQVKQGKAQRAVTVAQVQRRASRAVR